MGRYKSKQNARKKLTERVCIFCNTGQIEDEKHVLMSCTHYELPRQLLLKELFDIFPGLIGLDLDRQFEFIMQCQDYEVFKHLIPLLESIVTLRGSL